MVTEFGTPLQAMFHSGSEQAATFLSKADGANVSFIVFSLFYSVIS